MKVTVTIPDHLARETDAAAKALGLTRTKLVRTALEDFLGRRREEQATAALGRCISKCGADLSEEDEAWITLSYRTMCQMLDELDAEWAELERKRISRKRR